jgi:hypothetical protein
MQQAVAAAYFNLIMPTFDCLALNNASLEVLVPKAISELVNGQYNSTITEQDVIYLGYLCGSLTILLAVKKPAAATGQWELANEALTSNVTVNGYFTSQQLNTWTAVFGNHSSAFAFPLPSPPPVSELKPGIGTPPAGVDTAGAAAPSSNDTPSAIFGTPSTLSQISQAPPPAESSRNTTTDRSSAQGTSSAFIVALPIVSVAVLLAVAAAGVVAARACRRRQRERQLQLYRATTVVTAGPRHSSRQGPEESACTIWQGLPAREALHHGEDGYVHPEEPDTAAAAATQAQSASSMRGPWPSSRPATAPSMVAAKASHSRYRLATAAEAAAARQLRQAAEGRLLVLDAGSGYAASLSPRWMPILWDAAAAEEPQLPRQLSHSSGDE